MQNKILFCADASQEIGFGHVKRVCSLMKIFAQQHYNTKLLLRSQITLNSEFIADVTVLKSNQELVRNIEEFEPNLIVLDLLESDKNYHLLSLIMPKRWEYKILVIDSFYNQILKPDIVLAPWGIHDKSDNTMNGLDYLFFDTDTVHKSKKRIQKSPSSNILVTLGGADKNRITPVIAYEIAINFPDKNIHVVIGPLFSDDIFHKIYKYKLPNIYIHRNLSNLDELYILADLAIIGGGQSKFEAALFGLPALIIANTDSEIELSVLYANLGTSRYISDSKCLRIDKIIDMIIDTNSNPNILLQMSSRAKGLVDGNGGNRIIKYVEKKLFKAG